MSDSHLTTPKKLHIIGWIGTILIRIVIPIWILIGATSKVIGATPKSLPRPVLDGGVLIGFNDHFLLLAILVAIEFAFVGIMIFIPRVARIAAAMILVVFLIVLSVDMFAYGNYESCGCFGDKSMAPTTMFIVDLVLLIGIAIFKPKTCIIELDKEKRRLFGATCFIVIASLFTFITIMSSTKGSNNESDLDLPKSWFPTDIANWNGKSIDDIQLFSWVNEWPSNIHIGKQYVIFYSTTCDHCEALLYAFFEFPKFPTTIVAIPQSIEPVNYENSFENPCFDCAKTELLNGPDWIIGTPLVIAIDNGIVQCATENEDYEIPTCLIW